MTNFVQALEGKLSDLQEEREALEAQHAADLARIDAKVEAVNELLQDEGTATPAPKKKRGRPKGSKKKPKVDPEAMAAYEAAVKELGDNATTPEEQERRVSSFRPAPRGQEKERRNVKSGTKEEVLGNSKSDNARISIEDGE